MGSANWQVNAVTGINAPHKDADLVLRLDKVRPPVPVRGDEVELGRNDRLE
jgi:hypothetical protein